MGRHFKPKSAIEQAIEVCRPERFDPEGRDWLQAEIAPLAAELELDPQLAELRSRIGAIDSAIAAAIEQAPAPEGLAERLLARLQAAAIAEAASVPALSVATEPAEQVISLAANHPENGRSRAGGRRWWLAGAAALAAACLAGVWALRPVHSLSYEQILEAANDDAAVHDVAVHDAAVHDAAVHDAAVHDAAVHDAAVDDAPVQRDGWKPLPKGRPFKGYPLSSAISARPPRRSRESRAFLGRACVAYDIESRTGAKATLYVVPLNRVGGLKFDVPYGSPPNRPHVMTGGSATAAAWTDGTTLWVLVVQGGPREYRSFAPPGMA